MATATEPRLTVDDVAQQLRRNPQTVRRYARRGLLEGTKLNGYQYLFTQEQIDRFVESGATAVPKRTAPLPSRDPRYSK